MPKPRDLILRLVLVLVGLMLLNSSANAERGNTQAQAPVKVSKHP